MLLFVMNFGTSEFREIKQKKITRPPGGHSEMYELVPKNLMTTETVKISPLPES